ncbi:hypothetical protein HS1genome_1877 [Sulfodiicoccus acidiphilus]|uniref:Uncharacterized protein n=1 Tax=Sulfodiicoccus acidiphilus TaxID=1670455 RepID=A0A348B5N6_9CREN|nr:hypothetical protein HS1genome_1877 [Sulfodiicoccus acidiphilus]GGT92792.1 hypothetical protein GCM10007116_08210 [Sulfodiicoccus acidiphilus]
MALYDQATGRSYLLGTFPYATRKMWEIGMVDEFRTKIQMAAGVLEVLRREFQVVRWSSTPGTCPKSWWRST